MHIPRGDPSQQRVTRRHWVLAWLATIGVAALVVALLPRFFRFIQYRPGHSISDPLLALFPAADLSLPLFTVLYAAVLLGIVWLARRPDLLLRTAQAYVLLLLLRMLSMTVLTLEPPAGLVALHDPITQVFYPATEPFNKDLFFSGHTATLFLFFLAVRGRWLRIGVATACGLVGAAVLVQHVHYTIDVLAAPPFAWLAWRLSAVTARWTAVTGAAGA